VNGLGGRRERQVQWTHQRCARRSRWATRLKVVCSGWALSCSVACTEPQQRTEVSCLVDADSIVRDDVTRVDALLEVQVGNSGWQTKGTRRFDTNAEHQWPLGFRYTPMRVERSSKYRLAAVARDAHEAIVARASVIRELDESSTLELRVHFDAKCLRRDPLCDEASTCRRGSCVSPDYTPQAGMGETEIGEPALTRDAGESTVSSKASSQVTDGEHCEPEGARNCMGQASRTPLLCQGSVWRAQTQCAPTERCDTGDGDTHGLCLPIAPECEGREPGAVFCDDDEMKVCIDLVSSTPRTCGTNEHCVTSPTAGALCACSPGFIEDVTGCRMPTDCDTDNGGCDPLATCTANGTGRACGTCPSGYAGTGESGCAPLLETLRVSAGELTPTFAPNVLVYTVRVPLLVQRVTFRATAPAGSRIETNGAVMDESMGWSSPILDFGETKFSVIASSSFGVHSTYEVTVDRVGAQEAQLKAHVPGDGDEFGMTVALSGDTLVVGAAKEDGGVAAMGNNAASPAATNGGAIYVFVRAQEGWVQQAYLKSSDGQAGDLFGSAIAIDGDTIVASSLGDEKISPASSPSRAGKVYVFERKAGQWSETARLQAKASAIGDLFGASLAIEKDTLVITCERASGSTGGAAYVYAREAGAWTERATLAPQTPIRDSLFGSAVALSGDTIAVSSTEDIGSAGNAGAAYVFARRNGEWAQQARMQSDPPIAGGYFGWSLALAGDTLAVGLPNPDPYRTTPRGQVYVFERGSEQWSRTAVITAAVPHSTDYFGAGVALSGTTMLVGASGDSSGSKTIPGDPAATDAAWSGAAHLFTHIGNQWLPSGYLKVATTVHDQAVGRCVALSNDYAIVGAPFDPYSAGGVNPGPSDMTLRNAGAVYVLR
jgi:hypothetical protein